MCANLHFDLITRKKNRLRRRIETQLVSLAELMGRESVFSETFASGEEAYFNGLRPSLDDQSGAGQNNVGAGGHVAVLRADQSLSTRSTANVGRLHFALAGAQSHNRTTLQAGFKSTGSEQIFVHEQRGD